jgi:predicted nucleotidyltransferase
MASRKTLIRMMITKSASKMPDASTGAAIEAFRARLEQRFGGNLRGLVLFGSRARGDHRDDSDADVAVFLRPVADPIGAQMDMAADAYAVFLDTEILIQPWVFGGTPEHPDRDRAIQLLDAVQTEGIAL